MERSIASALPEDHLALPAHRRPESERVLVLAPTGRDTELIARSIDEAGLSFARYSCMGELCHALQCGAGAALISEEELDAVAADTLLDVLCRQPSWSDVPVIVLMTREDASTALSPTLNRLKRHANVTLLERPISMTTLVSDVEAALRARRRQYDVSDFLSERRALLEREREARIAAETARAEAEAANRAKVDFLAAASHELRTPLNAIAGYAELLAMGIRGPINEQQRSDLQRILRSERYLLGLINNLLNFVKIEAGRVHLDLTDVPLAEVMTDVRELIEPQVLAKGLHFDAPGCAPDLTAYADAEKLRQVVLNLLSNAVKFTGAGGTVALGCTVTEGAARIRVRDTGRGIPADKLGVIFDPFVQVDRSLTTTTDGTGLGLAISRDLARAMGGDILAESKLGQGSTFTIVLPSSASRPIAAAPHSEIVIDAVRPADGRAD